MFNNKIVNATLAVYFALAMWHYQYFDIVEVKMSLVSCAQVDLTDGDRYYQCSWEGSSFNTSEVVDYHEYNHNLTRLGSTDTMVMDDPRQHIFWIFLGAIALTMLFDWGVISKRSHSEPESSPQQKG